MSRRMSRRKFLAGSGGLLSTGLLAACAGQQPAPAAPTSAPQPTAAPAAAATTAPTATTAAAAAATTAPAATAAPVSKYNEAPMLAELVKAGQLPPVEERLPEEPWVIQPLDSVGQYGGKLSSIVADPTADLQEIEGALGRAIGGRTYDQQHILPAVVKEWQLSDDYTELRVVMRKGLKWSDGQPLTTADVMFWYEDIFSNTELTPTVDQKWAPGGTPMAFVADDDFTFTIKFAAPYPAILDFLPGLSPWAAKHYLAQWHKTHNPDADAKAKEEKYETWVQAFQFHMNMGQALQLQQDKALPTLAPWKYDSQDTMGNRIYMRNPYYWAVDSAGNQLPYADAIERTVVENREVLTAKVLAGEGTHHSWFLTLANYPLYKENEQKGNYTTNLHPDLRASECGFCFNYTHNDEVLRTLFQDLRWRQAMSHALNRDEINELRFAGLGIPRQPIMHPEASFWQDGLDQMYIEYNPEEAGKLLDDIGLPWDAAKKFRLRPDGQALALTMEVDAGRADLTEVCNMIATYWERVGINLTVKTQDQQFFMQRMRANEHDIGVWAIGGSSEVYSRQNEPIRYRPPWHWTNTPLGGPLWRQWLDTKGAEGMEPPDVVKELWETSEAWRQTPNGTDEYRALGLKMLQLNAESLWCIGTVGLVPRVGIVKNTVHNAPNKDQILSIEYDMWRNYLIDHWWIES
jgi:peptide/nickel transport system substrate-binding protein